MSKELTALMEQASMLPYEVKFDVVDGWFWQTFNLLRAIYNLNDVGGRERFEIIAHTTSANGKSIDAENWLKLNWEENNSIYGMPRVATFIYEDGRWVVDDYYPETINYHGRALPGDNSVKDKAKEHIKLLNDNIRSSKWKRSLESASREEEWNPTDTQELNSAYEQYCNKYLK